MDEIEFPKFTYSKRPDGLIQRSDGALVPVFDESNLCTQHYRRWANAGGKLDEHKPSEAELHFERGQEAVRESVKALVKEHGLKNEAELWAPRKPQEPPKPSKPVKNPEPTK